MNEIILYEELSMNAHPAIKTHVYDGWVLSTNIGCQIWKEVHYASSKSSIRWIYFQT